MVGRLQQDVTRLTAEYGVEVLSAAIAKVEREGKSE